MVVGRLRSFCECLFSGVMLVLGRVFPSKVLFKFLSTVRKKRSQSAEQTPCTWQVEVIKNPTTTIEIRVPKTAKVKMVNLSEKTTFVWIQSTLASIGMAGRSYKNREETQCISVQIPTLAMQTPHWQDDLHQPCITLPTTKQECLVFYSR